MDKNTKIATIAARREAIREAIERYADRELRRALGWGDVALTATPPSGGKNSLLFFVEPHGGEPVVVRAYEKSKLFRRHALALHIAGIAEAMTPRVLRWDGGLLTRFRYGYCFLTTEAAPGKRLDQQASSPALRDAVARSVARLHGARSSRWGKLDALRKDSYAQDLRRGIERRLAELGSRPSEMTSAQIESIRRWFLDRLVRFEELSTFQLCHHHLDADDILYDPSTDRATLIDCANIQFSRASRDLCGLRDNIWVEDARQWEAFLETYFAHSPRERRSEYEREAPFFRAFILLSKARNCILRAPGDGVVSLGEAGILRDLLELA